MFLPACSENKMIYMPRLSFAYAQKDLDEINKPYDSVLNLIEFTVCSSYFFSHAFSSNDVPILWLRLLHSNALKTNQISFNLFSLFFLCGCMALPCFLSRRRCSLFLALSVFVLDVRKIEMSIDQ